MEEGRARSRRPDADDVLARHGLLDPSPGAEAPTGRRRRPEPESTWQAAAATPKGAQRHRRHATPTGDDAPETRPRRHRAAPDIDPAPGIDPAPVGPAPGDRPAPGSPAPGSPALVGPAPAGPAPVGPAPVGPAPAGPAPGNPAPRPAPAGARPHRRRAPDEPAAAASGRPPAEARPHRRRAAPDGPGASTAAGGPGTGTAFPDGPGASAATGGPGTGTVFPDGPGSSAPAPYETRSRGARAAPDDGPPHLLRHRATTSDVDPPAGPAPRARHGARGQAAPNGSGRRRRAEPADAGTTYAGPNHAEPHNAEPHNAGPNHAGPHNAGPHNAGPHNAGPHDAAPNDAATSRIPTARHASRPPLDEPTSVIPRRREHGPERAAPTTHGGQRRHAAEPADDATRRISVPAPRRSEPPHRHTPPDDATTRVGALPLQSPEAPPEAAPPEETRADRAERIDQTLNRMTAAHEGLAIPAREGDEPDVDEDPTPRRRLPRITPVRVIVAVTALLVFLAAGAGFTGRAVLTGSIANAAALDPGSGAIVDAAAQHGDQNVLVVAHDPRGADRQTGRPDTLAVVHVPEGGGAPVVMAFPAELEINRPSCQRWDPGAGTYRDETVPAEPSAQLASTLDVGGPSCATRVIQQLSGLAITAYVGLDLGAVGALTDALGGAAVCVPTPIQDTVLGPVVPAAGPTRLAGTRAADFATATAVAGDPATDRGRIERQYRLLGAVLDQSMTGTALLDIGQVLAVRPALGAALTTDAASPEQVLAIARTLGGPDADGVVFAQVPTAGEANVRGNAVLRTTDAAALFAAVRSGTPLPTQPGEEGPSTGPKPADVTLQVQNASSRPRLADEVAGTLGSLGFRIGEVARSAQPAQQTVIRFSPDQAAAAALVASTVPAATSVPDPGATGVLQLVLGDGFDGVVRAPTEPVAVSAVETPQAAATCR